MYVFQPIFTFIFNRSDNMIYTITPLWKLLLNHMLLVLSSIFIATFVAVILAILVTREWGRDFLPMFNNLSAIGQTVPPIAVLVLIVPLLGYNVKSVLVALSVYAVFPILQNAMTSIITIPPSLIEAAKGQGMKDKQILFAVEIPLSFVSIIAGIRTSLIIATGTATIASTVSVKSLGEAILAGISTNLNIAYIFEGTILITLLAIILDWFCKILQDILTS